MNKDFLIEVAKGNVGGHSIINKFGLNEDVDTATVPEDVWNGGGLYTGFDATAADTLQVFSSDGADTAAGTGARTIHLFGLNEDYDQIDEIVTLTGATPAETTQKFIRMHRGIILSAGTGGANAGTITVRQKTVTAVVYCIIPIGENQTHVCAYTVPRAYKCYLLQKSFGIIRGVASRAEIEFIIRPFGEVFQGKDHVLIDQSGGTYTKDSVPLGTFQEKTDIVIRVVSVSANDTGVAASMDLLLVADTASK